jgi:hypothetical protein
MFCTSFIDELINKMVCLLNIEFVAWGTILTYYY